jgi:hypothetical protein
MKFVGATAMTYLLLASHCLPSQPSSKHQVLTPIEKLMQEVNAAKEEAGDHRLIHFVTSADTRFREGSVDSSLPSEIVINLAPPSGSQDYDDALKAHELFHIILNIRGFSGTEVFPAPNAAILFPENFRQMAMQKGGFVNQLAITLNSCFPDELIDRETARRGFKSRLVVQKEMNGRIRDSEEWEKKGNLEMYPDIIKHRQALDDFCVLNRLSDREKLKYESATEPMLGPPVDAYRKQLLENFKGKRCEFGDPEGCHRLTLELRGAAGYANVILLRKPKTGEPE